MNIEALRVSRGLTQEQLAREVSVSRSTVAMWESGKSNPTAKKMPKLASVLECTVDELLTGESTTAHAK